jgi:HTH-type transcriptional regulator/antitoxin HigA
MSFEPNWVSPPGATIERLMASREIAADDMADGLGLARDEFASLLSGKYRITSTLATALAQELGSTARFWLSRDQHFVSDKARLSSDAHTVINWAKAMPVSSMRKFGWIGKDVKNEGVQAALLSFFDCLNLTEWSSRYSSGIGTVAFRRSFAFDVDEMATLVWLRAGEKQGAKIALAKFDPNAFTEILPKLRKLSAFKRPSTFLPRLVEACRSVGVAVTTARAPDGCRASGATWILENGNPVIHLSFRHRAEDHFWFTFFHEAAHVLLHGSTHLDVDGDSSLHISMKEEAEADTFAQEILVPNDIREDLLRYPRPQNILSAARKIGVTPGIIVGQLERANVLPHGRLSSMKHRYRWELDPYVPELS